MRKTSRIIVYLAVAAQLAGCSGRESSDMREGPVTYSEHVAPILYEQCVACHRPEESAPFSLLTYEEAKRIAPLVATVTADKTMPPWLPASGYVEFADDRSLSEAQIEIIQRWVSEGVLEGDGAKAPPPPKPREGWELGEPDLVARMQTYRLPAAVGDVFRNFVIPAPLEGVHYVRAMELRCNNPKVVHHAQLLVDRTGSSRDVAARDPAPGFDGMVHTGGAETPDGFFLGWTPGKAPFGGLDGLAWRVDGQTDLVLMLHMRPRQEALQVVCEVALHFAEESPDRFPALIKLSAPNIDIPAGAADYNVEDDFVLPVSVEALSVYPHAHYLGKRIEGLATLPDGTEKTLVLIDNWDFNWQDQYRFAEPVFLPKGTRLVMRWTYDNSAENPLNPSQPPVRVVYGPESADEMSELMLQVLPANATDRKTLMNELWSKELEWQVELMQHQLRFSPDNPEHHYDLAIALQESGRVDEAIAHYELAIELRPTYAAAHNNLGTSLQTQGLLDEAMSHYQRALELKPDDASVHTNLGSALQAKGDGELAIERFRTAVRVDSGYAKGHGSLGFALAMRDEVEEAVVHFREAIRLDPDWVAPRFGAAWALATHPDSAVRNPKEAIAQAEVAAELTDRRDAMILDALAAAYAADGQFDRAVMTGEEAYWLAVASGQETLVRTIESRVELYKRGRPYRGRLPAR